MNLTCPYCGGSLYASADVTYDFVVTTTIECENYTGCGAKWDAAGKNIKEGRKGDGNT